LEENTNREERERERDWTHDRALKKVGKKGTGEEMHSKGGR